MLRKFHIIILTLFLCFVISSCSRIPDQASPTPDSDLYTVDPVFREFYNVLGGQDVLGEVISDVQMERGITYQYSVMGKMIFDPNAPMKKRFQMGPLGWELNLSDSYPTGLKVAEQFLPLYDQLGGELFVGKPLTDLIYNSGKNRSEQYFENLGFYLGPETNGAVRLLPYGVWICAEVCRDRLPLNASPDIPIPTKSIAVAEIEPATPVVVVTPETTDQLREWVVQVWESASVLTSNQQQEIYLSISRDGAPQPGVIAELSVFLPDGSVQTSNFPPTNDSGLTRTTIAPNQSGTAMPDRGSSQIQYQVCITGLNADRFCYLQSYLVWDAP